MDRPVQTVQDLPGTQRPSLAAGEGRLEHNALTTMTGGHVGRAFERLEDDALLTGRGRYADDLGVKPGTLYAAILRSPHAHAEIVALDASRALAAPSVRAVLTGADVKRWSEPFVVGVKQPMEYRCLAVERVRYVGEPVAVVVAESRALAEDALDLTQEVLQEAQRIKIGAGLLSIASYQKHFGEVQALAPRRQLANMVGARYEASRNMRDGVVAKGQKAFGDLLSGRNTLGR